MLFIINNVTDKMILVIEEIDNLISIFKRHECPLMLMHTVSTYPSKDEDLNLKCIETLSNKFNVPIGYSGHEVSTAPSIYAALLGAVAIERHVTLDRAMYGSDQSASLEIGGLKRMMNYVRDITKSMGSPEKRVMDTEIPIAEKLRKVESTV